MSSNIHILKNFPPLANKYFENVTQLKYLGVMPTNKNCICTEITSRLKWAMYATIQFRILFVLTPSDFLKEFSLDRLCSMEIM
jgi:hypothetical protein